MKKSKSTNKSLSEAKVKNIANLANLTLTEEEIKIFTPQLTEILDYFEKLEEVNTDNVKLTIHSGGIENRFQENDLDSDTLSQRDVLENAEQSKRGYIVTRRITTQRS